ncbi:MAG: CdaR family protein [Saprospiraceae bacterium]|nr:CdaR family protein [Saprospiraceae bacterium]
MIKLGSKKIRVQIREDRAVLMVCIGVAFIFWLLVKLSQTYSSAKNVVFRFNIPEDKALTILPPKDVEVQLEGRGWDLMFDYFSSPRVELFFDMAEQSRVRLNWLQLRSLIQRNLSSQEIQINEINYDNLSLSLEDKLKKKVPVLLEHRLTFASGYHLEDTIELTPDSIYITGPASLISNIRTWKTDSLRLENLKNTVNVSLDLESSSREIQLNTKTISARIPVEQFTEKAIFVPIQLKNSPDSIRVFPDRIKIYCLVGLSRYSDVEPSGFQVEVDLQNAQPGIEDNTVPINLTSYPTFVENVRFSPKSAEFIFIKERIDTTSAPQEKTPSLQE